MNMEEHHHRLVFRDSRILRRHFTAAYENLPEVILSVRLTLQAAILSLFFYDFYSFQNNTF